MYLIRVTASLLACTALAVPVLAQEAGQVQKPFKDALPAKTLAFFSVPDLKTSAREFQNTALAKMWRESEVQDFVADAMKLGQAKWAEGLEQLRAMNQQGQIPVSPDDILKLRVNSVSAAVTTLSIEMGEFKPQPNFGVLLHLDFGDSAKTWQKVLGVGLQMLEAQGQQIGMKKSVAKVGNVSITTFTPPAEANTKMSLNVAFVGSGLVIGTLQDDVKACVDAMVTGKSVLTTSKLYAATAKHISSDGAEVEGFVNIEGFINFAVEFLKLAEKEAPGWPEQLQVAGIERALTALGLRSVKTMAIASKYEGSKSVTRTFAYSPVQERQGLVAKNDKPLAMNFLNWVPKDVASLAAARLSIGDIYDGLVNALRAYNPEVADQMLAMLKQQEEQVGISLKNDFFDVFGDQMVWWSMGVQNFMSAPEGAMLLKIKDQQKLLGTLQKIAKMSNGVVDFPSSERKGIKTWRLELNPEAVEPQIAQALSFLQPCFAFKHGYMVMALATGDVRKAMKRMDRGADAEEKSDIRSNKEFKAYLAQMGQQEVSSFDWTDWKVSFENLYSALTSVLAFAVNADEVPFDLTLLPEAETLSQHLYSSATWSTASKDGFHSTSISPIGPEVLIGAVVVGGGAALAMVGMRTTAPQRGPVFVEPAKEAEATPPKKKGDGAKKGAGKAPAEQIK